MLIDITSAQSEITRVAVVDDDDEIREHVSHLLAGLSGFECVGLSCSAEEAISNLPDIRPDVVLMDIIFRA